MSNMRALKWIGGTVLILFVLITLFFTFGLNLLKGPITRAVSNATGRELVIEGRLGPVWSWVHPRLRAEGVTFANADWGKADYLLSADAIEASIAKQEPKFSLCLRRNASHCARILALPRLHELMVRRLWHKPLTRRPSAATLSHKGRGLPRSWRD